MPDDLFWRQVDPGDEVSFTFDARGRGRQNYSQDIKINQLVVKLDGWKGALKTGGKAGRNLGHESHYA